MIPQNVIDEILNRVSIVDVISKYVDLKKSGRNYSALCPFHNEKTPSFTVNEEKGFYHCFGCGVSGNTVKFLMEYRKMSFPEAIQELAHAAGIDLKQYSGDQDFAESKKKKRLYDINKEAMLFFHNSLLKSEEAKEARSYVTRRRLLPDTVKQFRLGYGGRQWQGALEFLQKAGYKEEEMLSASLISRNERGKTYDRFRERLIFPILDREERVVGFGGRVLDKNTSAAKYLNSSENPVFHKGNLLYGLNFAADAITRARECLLVEGYMDVIALHQAGITNCVAPLGTALTESQLQIVKRYADTVIFVFDGDEAGQKAANRALDIAANSGLIQWVLILPGNQDPYDYVMTQGAEGFLNYVKAKRKSPIDFKMEYVKRQVKGKIQFINQMFDYVSRLQHLVTQNDYLKKIADFTQTGTEIIQEEYRNYNNKSNVGELIRAEFEERKDIDPIELDFIAALSAAPALTGEVSSLITTDMLIHPDTRQLFDFMVKNTDKNSAAILEQTANQAILQEASRYIMNPESNPGMIVAYRLKNLYLKRIIEHNEKQMAKISDQKQVKELLTRNVQCARERKEIEQFIKKYEYEHLL